MDVKEAATHLGVTPRRVRALIGQGKIPALREGTRWEITELPATRSRRPLSPRSREQLARALHTRSLHGLEGQDRARTAKRVHLLRTVDDPAALLLEWWGGEAMEDDAYVRSLLERALAGDGEGVRSTLRRPRPAYLATPERLADRVSTERRIRGLKQDELADLAGVDISALRDLERGRTMRSPGPSRRVLKALGVSTTALPPMGAA